MGPLKTEDIKEIKCYFITCYYDGVRDGLRRFAWWKDGVEYVGSCGTTLKEALATADVEKREHLHLIGYTQP